MDLSVGKEVFGYVLNKRGAKAMQPPRPVILLKEYKYGDSNTTCEGYI